MKLEEEIIMSDYIVRATAANNQIRAFAITGRELVEEARKHHNTSPVATAALGRLLMGGDMMGVMMKGEKDVLTLQMKGDGPINGVLVTADSKGHVKGYVGNPNVVIPPNYAGKLDVGAAIGYGTLTVIKDMGLKEPYASQVPLGTSEVAEDLTYYFAKSEQVPSAVALGVLMEKNNTVKQAGGFIVQLMPFAEEEVIAALEQKISKITSVTSLLEKGMSPEDILQEVLGDLGVEFTDKIPTEFYCDCSKEKVSKALISVGKKELQAMIDEGKEIEVNCHFCNTNYVYSVEELKEIKKRSVS
jgi:molecular chaperone Hsp33